ncbi:phosphatidylserine decarboxylase [Sphingomonas montanisoli]|uniref:Phosphatidylserine decarboxylase proenzyme n=1 Tax=Sphingomonas montanisoli TaxID=2606412 RepID=A0A5D9CCX3_9SPHN|nr:phosphatidylserine decarboxylase [Sphingomonas montanisoli]TZG29103.1 phosphatidylserine decarboxylase [Sphingomonas montanisoli]
MTSLEKPDIGTTSVKWRWPSVHPEGRKFVLISAVICLIFAIMAWETLAWPMGLVTIWVAAFFRDPIRTTPIGEGLIVAPADGLVTMIVTVPPPREMAGPDGLGDGPMTRVSIFMSVFDVHINRTPIPGVIKRVAYIAGSFLNADLDKASEENERQHILVEGPDGTRIGFTQIAGLVARRIVPFVKPGDVVGLGQRIGLIRFGSRVDVYLPAGTGHRLTIGQRTIAGETVIAKLGEADRTVGASQ